MSGYVENVWWSVEERAWKQDLPHLDDDVVALLAPPVIVTASTRTEPEPPRLRMLAPAPPLRTRPRTAARHRPRPAARTA